MSNLNDLIDKTHFDYEQNETKAKELEERILKVPGMSKSYLPKRQYGQQFRGDQLGVTAQAIIVRGDKPLAAFLGLDLNYRKEKAKAEEEREAYLNAFKEKTEALRQKKLRTKNGQREKTSLESNPKGKLSLAQVIATNIQWRSHALHVKR
jgi:hypothetical protein